MSTTNANVASLSDDTATKALRDALDAVDDAQAILGAVRGRLARKLYEERTQHLGEALDVAIGAQESMELIRTSIANTLYTARTTPPATPNPVGLGMTASAKTTFGPSSEGGDS